jgi:hypothetical protein
MGVGNIFQVLHEYPRINFSSVKKQLQLCTRQRITKGQLMNIGEK